MIHKALIGKTKTYARPQKVARPNMVMNKTCGERQFQCYDWSPVVIFVGIQLDETVVAAFAGPLFLRASEDFL
jgi:hypothetical protein